MKKYIKYLKDHINFTYRLLTASKRSLPDFIIVGEAKCGTTSLYNYLENNSMLNSPIKKEIHYFDYKYSKGERWYKAHFGIKGTLNNVKTGEATPYYFFHPKALSRISKDLPNVKIILMVRNPKDRAISSFYNNIRRNLEPLNNFSDAIIREDKLLATTLEKVKSTDFDYNHKYHCYMERGLYYKNYERLLKHFDQKNIFVLEFDEFFSDLENQYKGVLDFLKLDKNQNIENKIHNKGSYKEADLAIIKKLDNFYEQPNNEFYKMIGKEFNWSKN